MEEEESDCEEEGFEFSRKHLLARDVAAGSKKKSSQKLCDIDSIDEQELRAAALSLGTKHENEISSLTISYRRLYHEWVFQLSCGFNLLMYGFGSKRVLIEDFASVALKEWSVLVVNGYLPSINIKQVLVAVAELLWNQMKSSKKSFSEKPFNSKSIDNLLSFFDVSHSQETNYFVCIIIHNIDGPGLRAPTTQQCLARIASCSLIRIVASIDHVNADLLWNKKMAHTQFKWYWNHVPTFSPYRTETVFFPLILAHGGTAQSTKTGQTVLRCLSANAQNVFKVLANYQLDHPEEKGIAMSDWFKLCVKQFFVSSRVTLKCHLTEFMDHELVKRRKDSDGQDCLYIPLTVAAIEKLLSDLDQ